MNLVTSMTVPELALDSPSKLEGEGAWGRHILCTLLSLGQFPLPAQRPPADGGY